MRLLLLFAALWFGQALSAQEPEQPKEFVERYNERYLTQPPQLESVVADVTAWNSDGEPFELSSTRGKYTVIVFGCLT